MHVLRVYHRGDFFPATRSEFESLKAQIEYEKFDGVAYHDLEPELQASHLKQRMKTYNQKVCGAVCVVL